MADSDTISGIENLKSAVSGETPAYQYKDPNTDMMKAISKCIDAATGETGTEYAYKNPNTDVIQKMDELAGAIAESGGGGSPKTAWRGSLDEYNNLTSIDNDTLYLCSYDYLGTTAIYIGSTKIYPVDIDPNNYDWLAGDGSNAFATTTNISWLDGSDFDIDFILGQSSYSGTQVLFGNSSSDINFNLILTGTEMKIYGFSGSSQEFIDTIVPNVPYKVTKRGSLYSFYRENTLLTTRTRSNTSSGKLVLFSWSGFSFSGKIQRLGFKFVTE